MNCLRPLNSFRVPRRGLSIPLQDAKGNYSTCVALHSRRAVDVSLGLTHSRRAVCVSLSLPLVSPLVYLCRRWKH